MPPGTMWKPPARPLRVGGLPFARTEDRQEATGGLRRRWIRWRWLQRGAGFRVQRSQQP